MPDYNYSIFKNRYAEKEKPFCSILSYQVILFSPRWDASSSHGYPPAELPTPIHTPGGGEALRE